MSKPVEESKIPGGYVARAQLTRIKLMGLGQPRQVAHNNLGPMDRKSPTVSGVPSQKRIFEIFLPVV